MKTKLITIKGHKVKCRALKVGEQARKGDVWPDGKYLMIWLRKIMRQEKHYDQIYRPLKSKPRTAKAGKKIRIATLAYGYSHTGRFEDILLETIRGNRSACFNAAESASGEVMPVTISYRKKK